MEPTVTTKQTFYECEEFLVEFQDISGQFHVHCTVNKFNKSILKALYILFVQLRDFATYNGYTEMVSVSPNRKFCELFGAEYVADQDGCEVMIWDLR